MGFGGRAPGFPCCWSAAGAHRAWRRQHLQGQEADRVHHSRVLGNQGLLVWAHTRKAAPSGGPSAHCPGREQFIPCPGPSVCTSSICMWKPSAPGGGGRWALGRWLGLAEITRWPQDGVSALLAEKEAPELTECPVKRAAVRRPEEVLPRSQVCQLQALTSSLQDCEKQVSSYLGHPPCVVLSLCFPSPPGHTRLHPAVSGKGGRICWRLWPCPPAPGDTAGVEGGRDGRDRCGARRLWVWVSSRVSSLGRCRRRPSAGERVRTCACGPLPVATITGFDKRGVQTAY